MKAKIQIATVYADCPACYGDLLDPETGSHCIVVGQFGKDQLFTCGDCGKRFKIESKAWK